MKTRLLKSAAISNQMHSGSTSIIQLVEKWENFKFKYVVQVKHDYTTEESVYSHENYVDAYTHFIITIKHATIL